ncbi:sugar transferase [Ensifer soli]|uniref:sugar transferase n=1 Tax=Ciceribacter sp. sgz301302 TaxID=3342379 RepID=UPI0035B832B7
MPGKPTMPLAFEPAPPSRRPALSAVRPPRLVPPAGRDPRAARPVQLAVKRAIDIAAATVGLALLVPLLPLIAVVIRLDSPGPVFVRDLHLGRDDIPFNLLAFRTGRWDGRGRARHGDEEPTRIGPLLRASGLAALPRLWNVLRGDMALVGPLPHAPDLAIGGRPCLHAVPDYAERHWLRPGLAGPAGAMAGADDAALVRRDLDYVRHFSLVTDLRILRRSAAGALRRLGKARRARVSD